MKIGQIQRNKIYEDILKSVKGLLNRSSYLCSGLSKSFRVSDVLYFCIIVPQEDFSVLALIEDRHCSKRRNLKGLKLG